MNAELNEYGVPETIQLPCGGVAHFCHESGFGYRCEDCMAVVGSVAQPTQCVEAANKYKVFKALGSNLKWDYIEGKETLEVSKEIHP